SVDSAPPTAPRPVGRPRNQPLPPARRDIPRRPPGRPKKASCPSVLSPPRRHSTATTAAPPSSPSAPISSTPTPPSASSSSSAPPGPCDPVSALASTSLPTPTPSRRRGRPRQTPVASNTTPRVCPRTGDKTDDLVDSGAGDPVDFSVTVSARNGNNIREQHYAEAAEWMTGWAVRGVISLERGEINNNLHCQGILTLGMKKSFSGDVKKEEAALRKKMRVDSGWKTEDHIKITIKRVVRQQTFSAMVGYCSKDEGRSH
ncbi:unnamed protein product, partial [Scytosiphon promiscuus]